MPEKDTDQRTQNAAPQAPRRRGRNPNSTRWSDWAITLGAIGTVAIAIFVLDQFLAGGFGGGNESQAALEETYTELALGVEGEPKPQLGNLAPGFRLLDPYGTPIALSDFRGTPVLINFWATWCPPCRKEIPDLIALQAEWGTSVQILGVNLEEPAHTVAAYAERWDINYPLPLDRTMEVFKTYRLTGLPETYFVDGTGVLRDFRIGILEPEIARCIVAGMDQPEYEPEDCR